MNNIYQLNIPQNTIQDYKIRLINQIWKLIPMKENNENWYSHLDNIIIEISGLQNILSLNLLILLSKLEGLRDTELNFSSYRSTVFRCISIISEVIPDE